MERLASGPGVDESVRLATLEDITLRKKAIATINEEWNKLLSENNNLQKEVNVVKGNLPTLQVIRANAKNQIKVLEAIKVLQIVKNSLGALQGAFKAIGDIKLVSLSPDRIRRLLGISDER